MPSHSYVCKQRVTGLPHTQSIGKVGLGSKGRAPLHAAALHLQMMRGAYHNNDAERYSHQEAPPCNVPPQIAAFGGAGSAAPAAPSAAAAASAAASQVQRLREGLGAVTTGAVVRSASWHLRETVQARMA